VDKDKVEVQLLSSDGTMDDQKDRVVPTSTKPVSSSLRVDGFARPLSEKSVRDLFSKYGELSTFWMDALKKLAYVTYADITQAQVARDAIYGVRFPTMDRKTLLCEFVSQEEVEAVTTKEPQISAPVVKKVRSAPTAKLDNLFRKTNAKPAIYWMPVSDDEIAARTKTQKEAEVKQKEKSEESKPKRSRSPSPKDTEKSKVKKSKSPSPRR